MVQQGAELAQLHALKISPRQAPPPCASGRGDHVDALRLEQVGCPGCGAAEYEPEALRADGLRIVRCATCRLAFVNPRPTPEEVAKLYAADYFAGSPGTMVGYSDYPVSAAAVRSTRPFVLDLIAREVPLEGARALDVGCAFGSLVYWLGTAGAKAMGIDPNPMPVAWGREHLGLALRCGTLDSLDASACTFDVVTMIDVIEHVVELQAFVERTAALLCTGGHLVIATPNFAAHDTYGDRCKFLSSSLEHLLYFEAPVLDELLARHGFVPTSPTRVLVQGPRTGEELRALVARRTAWWKRALRASPLADSLRVLRARLAPASTRYVVDPSGAEGDLIVGVYQKRGS